MAHDTSPTPDREERLDLLTSSLGFRVLGLATLMVRRLKCIKEYDGVALVQGANSTVLQHVGQAPGPGTDSDAGVAA